MYILCMPILYIFIYLYSIYVLHIFYMCSIYRRHVFYNMNVPEDGEGFMRGLLLVCPYMLCKYILYFVHISTCAVCNVDG